MSQPSSELAEDQPRGVIVDKPKTNVYTMMLLIALLAMIIGCIFLWLELTEYAS